MHRGQVDEICTHLGRTGYEDTVRLSVNVPGGMYTNTGCLYVRSESTIIAPNLSTSPYMSLVPPVMT
jgi:hypothetical protein